MWSIRQFWPKPYGGIMSINPINFHFVYSQVKNLRRKLEEAGASIEIKAVYGFGYKLID